MAWAIPGRKFYLGLFTLIESSLLEAIFLSSKAERSVLDNRERAIMPLGKKWPQPFGLWLKTRYLWLLVAHLVDQTTRLASGCRITKLSCFQLQQ